MRSLQVIAATTLIFGALPGVADYFAQCRWPLRAMKLPRVMIIGFAQMLALLSGISALLCIHLFLGAINRMGLMPFVIYRLALGVALLFVI